MARQRIDMQTISEPALVSPSTKPAESGRDNAEYQGIDRCSFDVEAEYAGLETRQSIYRRDDSLDLAKEHRIRQYIS